MPSPKKVAWAQLRVGILAIAAMTLLGILVFLLTGTKGLFERDVIIYTYMDDSAALTTGSPVRLNGILIGSVENISLSGSKDERRAVRMALRVHEDMLRSIPIDSTAAIGAENVLGQKYINIKMGHSTQTVQPGGELPSLDTREFDEVVQSGYALLTSLQGILKRVDALVGMIEAGKGSIGKLIVDEELYNRLLSIEKDVQKISSALASGQGTIGRLVYDEALYDDVRGSIARVNSLLEGLQEGQGTAGKLLKDPALYDEAHKTVAEVRRLVEDLNAGKGTAGKLLKSDELHNQLAATLRKLDDTIDRLNTGQGTLGQLMVNPQLYESINGASQELQGLLKDFRANPKKFLRIKLGLF